MLQGAVLLTITKNTLTSNTTSFII